MQNIAGKKESQHEWNIIIRTTGKREEYLLEALYSIVLQNYKNISVILVVHSGDNKIIKKQEEIAQRFKNFFSIKLVKADNSKKIGHPMNVGLENCTGKYISFLDDDDIYYPDFGSRIIKEIEEDDYNFAYGVAMLVKQEKFCESYKTSGKSYLYFEYFNPVKLLASNYIQTGTYIFKREVFKDLRFNEDMDILEDWEFLYQLIFSSKLKPIFIPQVVSEHRRRNDGSNSFEESEVLTKKYREAVKIIKQKYENKVFSLKYNDVFKIYPDHSKIFNLPTEQSEISNINNELEKFKQEAEKNHKKSLEIDHEYRKLVNDSINLKWLVKRIILKIFKKI